MKKEYDFTKGRRGAVVPSDKHLDASTPDKERDLKTWEESRDLGAELLQAVKEMKTGKTIGERENKGQKIQSNPLPSKLGKPPKRVVG